jgi:hypothetical protein
MRFTVTQIRVGILLLNLILTLLVGSQTVYAILRRPAAVDAPRFDPVKFSYAGSAAPSEPPQVSRVPGIGQSFFPPKVVAPPPAPDSKGEKKPEPEVGQGELPKGPLDEGWEYVQCIIELDPRQNRATLQKKDASASMPGAPAKRSAGPQRKIIKSAVSQAPRTGRPPIQGGAAGSASGKTIQVGRRWVDEDLKIDIRVREITKGQFVYEEHSHPGILFALTRASNSIYDEGENGTQLKNAKEEADPANADPKDKEKHFHPQPPDFEKEFETWGNLAGSGASPVASPKTIGPNAGRGAQEGPRPPSKEEQLKALKDLQGLQKNPEYLKQPKAQRDQLQKLLEGGKK